MELMVERNNVAALQRQNYQNRSSIFADSPLKKKLAKFAKLEIITYLLKIYRRYTHLFGLQNLIKLVFLN